MSPGITEEFKFVTARNLLSHQNCTTHKFCDEVAYGVVNTANSETTDLSHARSMLITVWYDPRVNVTLPEPLELKGHSRAAYHT
jgi:hypothetical protein